MIPFLSLFIGYSPLFFEISIFILLLTTFLRIFYFPYNKNELKKLFSRFKKRFTKPTLYPESISFQQDKITDSENSHLNKINPFVKLEIRSMKRKEWLENQNESYLTYMDQLKFTRSQIKSRLRKFQKYESFATPFQINKNRYFYYKKLQKDLKHNVLYTTLNVRHKGNILLDPNIEFKYSSATLIGTWISFDAEKLCYAYTDNISGDSNHIIIRIRDISDGKDSMIDNISLPAEGSSVFSLCWLHKHHTGFFYTRLDADSDQKYQHIICFHQIGTTQNNDIVIYTGRGDAYDNMVLPSLTPIITVTYNDDYLIIELFVESDSFSRSAYSMKGNRMVIIDISHFDYQDKNSLGGVFIIADSVSNRWEYINNNGVEFLFRTNYLSEGFRVVKSVLDNKGKSESFLNDLVEYIPSDSKKMIMEKAYMAAQTVLVLKYFNSLNGAHEVLLYDLCESGACILRGPLESVASLPHPPFGVIGALNCSYFSNDIFYGFSSFSEPSSIYRAVVRRHAEDQDIELSFDQVYSSGTKSIDSSLYSTRRIEFTGEDGTQIPIYIFGLKSSFESKNRPCILHVRKSFGYPLCPQFSLSVILFVKYYNGFFCTVDLYSRRSNDHSKISDQWRSVQDLRRAAAYLTGNSDDKVNIDTTNRKSNANINNDHPNNDDDVTDKAKNTSENIGNKNITYTRNNESEPKSVNCTALCAPGQLALHTGTNGSITAALCIIKYPRLFNAVAIDEGIFDLMRYHLLDPVPPLPFICSPFSPSNSTFVASADTSSKPPLPSAPLFPTSFLPLPPVTSPLTHPLHSLSISTSNQSLSVHDIPTSNHGSTSNASSEIAIHETHDILTKNKTNNSDTNNMIDKHLDHIDKDRNCPSSLPSANLSPLLSPSPSLSSLPSSSFISNPPPPSSTLLPSQPPLSSRTSDNDLTWSDSRSTNLSFLNEDSNEMNLSGDEVKGGVQGNEIEEEEIMEGSKKVEIDDKEVGIEEIVEENGESALGENDLDLNNNDEVYGSCKQELNLKCDIQPIINEYEIDIHNKEIRIDENISVIDGRDGMSYGHDADKNEANFKNDELEEGSWKRHALYEEFGCSEESENESRGILTISPLHLILEKNTKLNNKKLKSNLDDDYKPAILLITREHSIRSVHSYKFIAALQDNVDGRDKANPLLLMNIRTSTNDTNFRNEKKSQKSPSNVEKNEKNENIKIENTAMSDTFSFLAHNIQAKWSGSLESTDGSEIKKNKQY